MTTHDVDVTELVVSQQVPAPIEGVWQAWTTAEGWRRWWWPHWADTVYEVDARPGGRYLARSAEGDTGVEGEFLLVEAPRTLELTWRWDGEDAEDHVHVELTPEGTGTSVVVRHLTTQAGLDDYRAGWEYVLGGLTRMAG